MTLSIRLEGSQRNRDRGREWCRPNVSVSHERDIWKNVSGAGSKFDLFVV
jgi:hypothetical protein